MENGSPFLFFSHLPLRASLQTPKFSALTRNFFFQRNIEDPSLNFSEKSVFVVAKQVAAGLVSHFLFFVIQLFPRKINELK